MKKMIFMVVILMASTAWAQPAFDLKVIRGQESDTLMFSANYDEDIYACYLELAQLEVVGDEVRASIDEVSPRRCLYIEAPDYGMINLSKLPLKKGLYKVVINGIFQGSLNTSDLKLNNDVVLPEMPEYF